MVAISLISWGGDSKFYYTYAYILTDFLNTGVVNHDLIASFFIILAFLNLPFVLILSKVIKTDFITTGYLLTAEKNENS